MTLKEVSHKIIQALKEVSHKIAQAFRLAKDADKKEGGIQYSNVTGYYSRVGEEIRKKYMGRGKYT